MQSVMSYNQESSSYTDENTSARPSDADFFIKQLFYEEYRKAYREKTFNGTYNEYLSYRDYT